METGRRLAPALSALACCLVLAAPASAADPTVGTTGDTAAASEPADAGPVATTAPTTSAPSATPAQSGGNEYVEPGVPLGTGETEEPDQVEPEPEPTPEPAPDTTSGSTTPPPAVAQESVTEAPSTTAALPRTGAESWFIALVGAGFLGAGIALRSRALAARS